ncbi:hypothetical protein [Pseudomarimonas arenosa]|uniref:Uncharacterized protein n=1 Tax=Pseudomarimonas arenosa TaxID=2774145 RepID=A0AAW3ZIZ8_9GAMM|nr:hypothetical protein [Pseudomarimonas arenosa]MBD8525758.1 hypothetical protein [Pseudomarimonas arenosa]
MHPSITVAADPHATEASERNEALDCEIPVSITHHFVHDDEWGDIEEIVVESESAD